LRPLSAPVTFALLALVATVGTAAGEQTPASAVRCDEVLSREEATAVVGSSYEGPDVNELRPGFTLCEWQGSDSNFGFTFASLKALADDSRTADEEFESDVSAVENDTRKREVLPGVGVKAALVALGDDALLISVLRADGVARMVTYKVDREKALALARAIAEP